MIIKEKIIKYSNNSYLNNNDFYNHFEKFQLVINEIKQKNNFVKHCNEDLLSLLVNLKDRNNYLKKFTNSTDDNLSKLTDIKNKMGIENINNLTIEIASNREEILKNLGYQSMRYNKNMLIERSNEINLIIDKVGNMLKNLNVTELEILKKLVEENELLCLLTMEPILITKIGCTLILKNWLYLHGVGNFKNIIKNSFETNLVILDKINKKSNISYLFNERFIFKRYDITFNKKVILGSLGVGTLFTSYYLNILQKNSKIIEYDNSFNGFLGNIFIDFRSVFGKLAYEVGHTTSYLTNQILLGVFTPKKALMQDLLKNIKKW